MLSQEFPGRFPAGRIEYLPKAERLFGRDGQGIGVRFGQNERPDEIGIHPVPRLDIWQGGEVVDQVVVIGQSGHLLFGDLEPLIFPNTGGQIRTVRLDRVDQEEGGKEEEGFAAGHVHGLVPKLRRRRRFFQLAGQALSFFIRSLARRMEL